MKKIIYIAMVCLTAGLFASCTQYNFDDTGLANGKHETTMWDYFKGDKYNWELLCEMAERADLIPLFQGTSRYGKDFTFFGPTSHSIRRYLYANGMEKVSDIPVSDCRTFILNCILPGRRVMLDDFKEGVKSAREARWCRWLPASSCGFIPSMSLTTMCREQVLCGSIWFLPQRRRLLMLPLAISRHSRGLSTHLIITST